MIGTAIGTLMLIGVIAIMVMRFYNQDIVPMKNNRMWMNTAAYVDYIPTQHTLVLKKRGPELSKAIQLKFLMIGTIRFLTNRKNIFSQV